MLRWEELRYVEVYNVVGDTPDPTVNVEVQVIQRELLRELLNLWDASLSQDDAGLLEAAELSLSDCRTPSEIRRYKRLKERLRRTRKRCVEKWR